MLGRELRTVPELAYGRPPDAPNCLAYQMPWLASGMPSSYRAAWKWSTDSPDTKLSRQGFVRSDAMTCTLRGRTSRLRTLPGFIDLTG